MSLRTHCAVCSSTQLDPLHAFGKVPLANGYASPNAEVNMTLLECFRCGHLQLLEQPEPTRLFQQYVYKSATTNMQSQVFHSLVERIGLRTRLHEAHILDVGCNDGALLRIFSEHGAHITGVDPNAPPELPWARACWWDIDTAVALNANGLIFDVITFTNTFAHFAEPRDALAAAVKVLAPDGLVVIQIPWRRDLLANGLYDTIYHEHQHYFGAAHMRQLAAGCGLVLLDADYLPNTHGGSLTYYLRIQGREQPSIPQLIALDDAVDPVAFSSIIARQREALQAWGLTQDSVWLYGASAKAIMLLAANRAIRRRVTRIFDDTPTKVGRIAPGTDLVIESLASRDGAWPTGILIGAWNYADRIAERLRGAGFTGEICVPFPLVHTV